MTNKCNECGYYGRDLGYIFTECCSDCDRNGLNPYRLYRCNVCEGTGVDISKSEEDYNERKFMNYKATKHFLPSNGYMCR